MGEENSCQSLGHGWHYLPLGSECFSPIGAKSTSVSPALSFGWPLFRKENTEKQKVERRRNTKHYLEVWNQLQNVQCIIINDYHAYIVHPFHLQMTILFQTFLGKQHWICSNLQPGMWIGGHKSSFSTESKRINRSQMWWSQRCFWWVSSRGPLRGAEGIRNLCQLKFVVAIFFSKKLLDFEHTGTLGIT